MLLALVRRTRLLGNALHPGLTSCSVLQLVTCHACQLLKNHGGGVAEGAKNVLRGNVACCHLRQMHYDVAPVPQLHGGCHNLRMLHLHHCKMLFNRRSPRSRTAVAAEIHDTNWPFTDATTVADNGACVRIVPRSALRMVAATQAPSSHHSCERPQRHAWQPACMHQPPHF